MRSRDKRRLRNCTSITRFRIWWCRRLRTGLIASFRILRWAMGWRKSKRRRECLLGCLLMNHEVGRQEGKIVSGEDEG